MTKLPQRKQYRNQVLNTESAKDIRKRTTRSEKQMCEGYQHQPSNIITHLHFLPLLQWPQQQLNRTIPLGTSTSMICNETTRACKGLSESKFFLPFLLLKTVVTTQLQLSHRKCFPKEIGSLCCLRCPSCSCRANGCLASAFRITASTSDAPYVQVMYGNLMF